MAIHLPTQIASGSNGLEAGQLQHGGDTVKILFPQDVSSHGGNAYVFQLMDALIRQPDVSNVGSGCGTLYWPKPNWDVIHIQWPEALVGWEAPTRRQIEALGSTLEQAKRHASLVVTIHNYNPKERMGQTGHKLYQSVYEKADAFVHLGQRSSEWFRNVNKDCDWCTAALHAVIEHGVYRIYNFIKQGKSPVLPSAISTTKFLVIGTMRSKEEIRFAKVLSRGAAAISEAVSQAK